MMYLRGNNSTFVIGKNGKYIVGRIAGDIIVKNSSVSRKHAEIEVENHEAYLRDCNSKYSTKYNGKALVQDDRIRLENGSQITFGEVTFKFEKEAQIITCSSSIKDKEQEVETIIKQLGGVYLKNWSNTCTHLTIDEIVITIKVLHAVMDNRKIVTPEYWNAYAKAWTNNKTPPDPSQYYPSLSPTVLDPKFVEFHSARETIFKEKTFAFCNKKRMASIEELISKAGGNSILVETAISNEDLLKIMDKFIVMEPENIVAENKFANIFNRYKKSGKRLIPFQEIAFAIMQCSCEENCNPSFNRAQKVFSKEETQTTRASKPVVEETPYELVDVKIEETARVIPASYEENFLSESKPISITELNSTRSTGIYRARCDIEVPTKKIHLSGENEETPAKRIKLASEYEEVLTLRQPSIHTSTQKTKASTLKRSREMGITSLAKKAKTSPIAEEIPLKSTVSKKKSICSYQQNIKKTTTFF